MANKDMERRRHRRIEVNLPVRVSTVDPERQEGSGEPLFRLSRDMCLNLSRSGAQVRMSDSIKPGTRVLIELHLPGQGLFEAIGRVAWKKGKGSADSKASDAGIGLEFLSAPRAQFFPLYNYLLDSGTVYPEHRVAYLR